VIWKKCKKCNLDCEAMVVPSEPGKTRTQEEDMPTSGLSVIWDADPLQSIAAGGLFLFLSVLMICIFSFISIAVWTEGRRKEREAYYKAESMRRLAEMPGDAAKYVIEVMREEERIRQGNHYAEEVRKREGMKLGGLITIAVGVALMSLIGFAGHDPGAVTVGLFPGLIGVALLVYVMVFAPKLPRA
jgi:hypothetical protein